MGDAMDTGLATNRYLTPERLMMRDLARSFVQDEVLPVANRLDPEKGDIPVELIEKMGDLGFFGILIPQELGGLGLGCFEYCLVAAWQRLLNLKGRDDVVCVVHELHASAHDTRASSLHKIDLC